MKRRHLNGHPVYEPGEHVEVFDGYRDEWVRAVIEKRYVKAEIPSGLRLYEYGVRFEEGETFVHMLVDDAAFVRVPARGPRVLRANKVKRGKLMDVEEIYELLDSSRENAEYRRKVVLRALYILADQIAANGNLYSAASMVPNVTSLALLLTVPFAEVLGAVKEFPPLDPKVI